MISGKDSASALVPSSARREMIGFPFWAYNASTVLFPCQHDPLNNGPQAVYMDLFPPTRTGMRDRVDTACSTQRFRQRHCQINIVYHRSRQYLWVTPRCLASILRLAQNRRHLASRIRRWDADMWQASANADGLTQADGGSTSNADDAVCLCLFGVREGLFGDGRRGVHRGFSVGARGLD